MQAEAPLAAFSNDLSSGVSSSQPASRCPRALLFAAALMFAGGCKKTVEGEQQAYESNVAEVTALKATYPGFAGVLDARLQNAKGIHDSASSLSASTCCTRSARHPCPAPRCAPAAGCC